MASGSDGGGLRGRGLTARRPRSGANDGSGPVNSRGVRGLERAPRPPTVKPREIASARYQKDSGLAMTAGGFDT